MKSKFLLRILFFLFVAISYTHATDMMIKNITYPVTPVSLNSSHKVDFVVRNNNILAALNFEWYVTVKIYNPSNAKVMEVVVNGAYLAPNTDLNMSTAESFVPTTTGIYRIVIKVTYLYEIDPTNDELTRYFTVIDKPSAITNTNPANGAHGIPHSAPVNVTWVNPGSTPENAIFLSGTTQDDVNPNLHAPITLSIGNPVDHGTIPAPPPATLIYWSVRLSNGAGYTDNGPFHFWTQSLFPSDLTVNNPTRPFAQEFLSLNMSPSFRVYNLSANPAHTGDYQVYVNIKNASSVSKFNEILNGVEIPANGNVNFTCSSQWLPDATGNYTMTITIDNKFDSNEGNNTSTFNFTVYDKPGLITNRVPDWDAINVPYSPSVHLDWDRSSNPVSYSTVYYGTTPSAANPSVGSPYTTSTSECELYGVGPGTEIWWTVVEHNGAGSTINPTYHFTTLTPVTPCSPPPTCSTPANGATEIPFSPTPNLTWINSTNTGVTTIRVYAGSTATAANPATATPIFETTNLSTTSCPLPASLAIAGGKVYWCVAAVCPSGTSTSTTFQFTFSSIILPNAPVITFPVNNSTDLPFEPFLYISLNPVSPTNAAPPDNLQLFMATTSEGVNASTLAPITQTLHPNQTTFSVPVTLTTEQDYYLLAKYKVGSTTISGTVTKFKTARGTNFSGKIQKVYTPTGTPILIPADLFDINFTEEVTFAPSQKATINKSTKNGEGGTFQFLNGPPGSYIVNLGNTNGWTFVTPSAQKYTGSVTTPGQHVTTLDFILIPPPSDVTGEIWNDANSNGVKDATESKIPNININLTGASFSGSSVQKSVKSNDQGIYTIPAVQPGAYTLTVSPSSGWTQTYPVSPASHIVTVDNGASYNGYNFGLNGPGSIEGQKFVDANANKTMDSNEYGMNGVTITLYKDNNVIANSVTKSYDINSDSKIDPKTEMGIFRFENVQSGNYVIKETVPVNWTQTFPVPPANHIVNMASGQTVSGLLFGNTTLQLDYGDAPQPYPTLAPNGAKHFVGAYYLGKYIDPENNGQPDVEASLDDKINLDDEDGIEFTTSIKSGQQAKLNVTIEAPINESGFLNGWIDYNKDYIWDNNNSEHVIKDVQLSKGTTELKFQVPENISQGTSYARFRFSTISGIQPDDQASNIGLTIGEIEDYRLELVITGIENETSSIIPSEYRLSQNYPNPFNPETSISYQIPHATYVTLKIYDMLGREITSLVEGYKNAGIYNVRFGLIDETGKQMPSGIYIYKLSAGNFVDVKKMMLTK